MASDSDDPAPPRGKRRLQTAEERDAASLVARRDRDQRSRDQIDELARATEEGAPETVDDDDNTKPIIVLSPGEMFLNERLDRFKREVKRGRSDTANRITEAMGARPPNERMTAIETRLKLVIAVLAAVASLAAGAAVTVAKGLYERGQTDGEHEIRLRNVERAIDQLQQRAGGLYTPLSPLSPLSLSKGNPSP